MLDYVLPIAACFYALLQLKKDWEKHETTLRRAAAFVLVLILGVGSAVNTHYSRKKAAKQHGDDVAQIVGLKKAVETANHNQEANTQLFVGALSNLSHEVADLKTEAATEKLQARLTSVQAELQKTQQALAPAPKAELGFTFSPFSNPPPPAPMVLVTDTTLPLAPDGSVHIEFQIVNETAVDAMGAEINLTICDQCKFAKEPQGLAKVPGLKESQRYLSLHDLLAKSVSNVLSVDVTPPPPSFAPSFMVGVQYRCHTCVLNRGLVGGTVHFSR